MDANSVLKIVDADVTAENWLFKLRISFRHHTAAAGAA
jgi:hypothetical protein